MYLVLTPSQMQNVNTIVPLYTYTSTYTHFEYVHMLNVGTGTAAVFHSPESEPVVPTEADSAGDQYEASGRWQSHRHEPNARYASRRSPAAARDASGRAGP